MKNKNYICPHQPQEQCRYDHDFWYICVNLIMIFVHLCKMIISLGAFFIFSKSLLFYVVKRAKTVQNDKIFCLSYSISQEQYLIWLSFMMHVENDNISMCLFQFFKILIFWALRGAKGKNTVQNEKTFCLVFHILATIHIMTVICGTHV